MITKSLRYSSLITTNQDSTFLLMLLDLWETMLRCQPIWQVLTIQLLQAIGGGYATKIILQGKISGPNLKQKNKLTLVMILIKEIKLE